MNKSLNHSLKTQIHLVTKHHCVLIRDPQMVVLWLCLKLCKMKQ